MDRGIDYFNEFLENDWDSPSETLVNLPISLFLLELTELVLLFAFFEPINTYSSILVW